LIREGYSVEDATYAADVVDADWDEQAAKSAQDYLDTMSFSRKGLINQLKHEGFTEKQAVYGVSQTGL
jgi:colicin import membrane protein